MFFSISALFEKASTTQPKVHDYTRQQQGQDYCFGSAPNESNTEERFYMTGMGDGVQQNDYIVLQQASGSARYQVVELNRYGNVKNLWIALLAPVDQS
jgi:hypothetical protein